jgi:putative Mg2+ transporter-C (MgtC) family protein
MEGMVLFQTLSWPEAIFRVALALLFGFCLGYDRGQKNKPVDYRVFMIVATISCLLALMGEELMETYRINGGDVEFGILRIVDGVLTGIGFLGAGAIIKSSNNEIIGTATGASIWGSGSVGLMIGFGQYGLAILGFGVLVMILVLFGFLKKTLFNQSDVNDETGKPVKTE